MTGAPPLPAAWRYADGRVSPDGRWIVCVREAHPLDPPAGGAPTEPGTGRSLGKVVTVFSSKGGCGKTFLSTNLAVALSQGGAEVALEKLAGETGADKAFYEGKVAAAQFLAQSTLPLVSAQRAMAEATDLSLMELDESAF